MGTHTHVYVAHFRKRHWKLASLVLSGENSLASGAERTCAFYYILYLFHFVKKACVIIS